MTQSQPRVRKLGRRRPKLAPALMLSHVLTGAAVPVIEHPAAADHFDQVTDWGLYGNDRFGDCGPVSVANLVKLLSRHLTGTERSVTVDDVFDLYKASGNPDFDPVTGNGDNGVDMQTMLEALVAGVGVGAFPQPIAFAKVDVRNLDEVDTAIAIFGGVLFGVDLDRAQQTQTDNGGPWDYVAKSATWGGHAVMAASYTTTGGGVVTWAEVLACTNAFMTHQLEECWVLIFPEHLTAPGFLAGVDRDALERDYTALTGRPFPVEPTPDPGPAPTPAPAPPVVPPVAPVSDPDAALAAAIEEQTAAAVAAHVAEVAMAAAQDRENRANLGMLIAQKQWLKAKGL